MDKWLLCNTVDEFAHEESIGKYVGNQGKPKEIYSNQLIMF